MFEWKQPGFQLRDVK